MPQLVELEEAAAGAAEGGSLGTDGSRWLRLCPRGIWQGGYLYTAVGKSAAAARTIPAHVCASPVSAQAVAVAERWLPMAEQDTTAK